MAPTYIPEWRCRPPWVGHRPVGTCTRVSGEPGHHMYVHGAGDGSGEQLWVVAQGSLRPGMTGGSCDPSRAKHKHRFAEKCLSICLSLHDPSDTFRVSPGVCGCVHPHVHVSMTPCMCLWARESLRVSVCASPGLVCICLWAFPHVCV